MGSSCEGMCEWSGSDWICHVNDDQLKCHALKKEGGLGWYCTLKKGHKEDHMHIIHMEDPLKAQIIRRWKQ